MRESESLGRYIYPLIVDWGFHYKRVSNYLLGQILEFPDIRILIVVSSRDKKLEYHKHCSSPQVKIMMADETSGDRGRGYRPDIIVLDNASRMQESTYESIILGSGCIKAPGWYQSQVITVDDLGGHYHKIWISILNGDIKYVDKNIYCIYDKMN